MKRVLGIVAVSSALLALLGVVVLAGGDSATFVPPPEAVAEGFVRSLAARRFSEAVPYLTRDLARRNDPERLRREWEAFERAFGRAEVVRGEPGTRSDVSATAEALVETRRDRHRISFELSRQKGLWRIARFSLPSGR